jgi:hypothetical protein
MSAEDWDDFPPGGLHASSDFRKAEIENHGDDKHDAPLSEIRENHLLRVIDYWKRKFIAEREKEPRSLK